MSLLSGNDDVGSEDDAQSEDGETSSFGISSNNTIDRELPSRGDVITAEKDVCSAKKPLTITASSLILMAKHCPLLEFLCLASTAITDDTLFLETGDYMSTLQSGPRSGLTNIQVTVTEGIEALGRHCPYLGRVWLVGCDWITYREVLTLTKSCRRLRMLDLRHCPRLEGRLCRLYVVLEEEHNSLDANDSTSVNEYDNVEATNHGIWQEKVATPLEFETAPTNVLLGANDAGREN
ncbi:hypothetical protein FBU30_008385 [Linnemannia zychae]|nr:hypothetical protein FBU30_008385 [Linnemannia zychae]